MGLGLTVFFKLIYRAFVVGIVSAAFIACEDEPPPPPKPPQIVEAEIACGEDSSADYPLVEEVSVRITDEDGDLLQPSLRATINGLLIGLRDDDGDELYTFSPGSEWNPPMICKGEFTLLVWASDLAGNQAKETLVVAKP